MHIPMVNLAALHAPLRPDILRITQDLLDHGTVMGGAAVPHFEQAWARYLGVEHCVACANGTDALEIVLRAMNIGVGDEVIVSTNGWLSAAEAVCLVGATPVYVDNHPVTYNINPALVEKQVTERTRAIIPIHLYGRPADMSALLAVAQQHNLSVIEDAAQAHGASIHGQKVGTWGHAAIFSFYPTKNLGALGDGGAITTHDDALAERARSIAQHGQLVRNYPVRLGRNSRMDNLQAAVLTLKLPYLDQWNQRRRLVAEQYQRALSNTLAILPAVFSEGEPVHHLFVVRVENREYVRSALRQRGIMTAVHYPQTVIDMMQREESRASTLAPVAYQQTRQLLSIPIHPTLSDEEVDYVISNLKELLAPR